MIDLYKNILLTHKDKIFTQYKKETLSFGDLEYFLQGIKSKLPPIRNRTILLLAQDCLDVVLLHILCWTEGSAIVPVSPFAASSALRHILSKTAPFLLITTEKLFEKNSDILNRYQCSILDRNYIIIPAKECKAEESAGDCNRVGVILFTSGTTGTPKGVCLGWDNVLIASEINRKILSFADNRSSLVTVPLYDYYGLIQIFSHLFQGNFFIFGESGLFPKSTFNAMHTGKVTSLVLVPYTLAKLLEYVEKMNNDTSMVSSIKQLKIIASSSDILTPNIIEKVFEINSHISIINVYGLVEAGRACFREIKKDSPRNYSIGKPSPGMEVLIEKQEGNTGQIVIRGPTVMKGYLKGIKNGKILFNQISEIHTQDIGYYDSNNEIIYIGRKDHLFNISGIKLHPIEIEQPLIQSKIVSDCRASCNKNSEGDFSISLEIVRNNADDESTKTKIIETLKHKIHRIFIPDEFHFVDKIERTELGLKIKRAKDNTL